ncbi:MAG: TIGR00282 family metallophosphoesterase [Firmicutes bacterium]|nr:TIGR00282 family metallophosphoesterase [Bacillota bacterium]
MRLLFLGDVVGRPGRRALATLLPSWREEEQYDFVLANAENAAGGFGLTPSVAGELFRAGVDVLTLGNHAFANREVTPLLENEPRVLRPANYPAGVPGRGGGIFPFGEARVAVLNLLGRVFLDPLDDPFAVAEREVERLKATTPFVVVDFHAEATSEKVAMGWFLDGKASAVIGTHTHVQTADERILPRGTAYITDVGMCGPRDGILGVEREAVIRRFRTQMPARFSVAAGPVVVAAVGLHLASDGRALEIKRYQLHLDA